MRASKRNGAGGQTSLWLRNNVIGLVAIVLALGGTAVAASTAKKNSVTSKSIKNGQVKSADIGDGQVGSADVAQNGLTGGDIDEASLQGLPIPPLADGAVTTAKLGNGAVTTPKLAPNAVDAGVLANDAVDTNALQIDSVDGAAIQSNTVTGVDVLEQSVSIPTAWAQVADAGPGAANDPTIVQSEGVIDVDDGPGNGDGFYCFDLAGNFTPEVIVATDQQSGQLDVIMTAQAPPPAGCDVGDEAEVIGTDASTGLPVGEGMQVAFFDL